MTRRWLLLIAACGGAPVATVENAVARRDVELVISHNLEARVYSVGRGLVLERTIALPAEASGLAWVDDRPIALLRGAVIGDPSFDRELTHDGEIGWLDSRYEPFPRLPPATWAAAPTANAAHPGHPDWTMIVTATREVWQGRTLDDMAGDSRWVFARIVPEPIVTTRAIPRSRPDYAFPVIAAPPSITATIDKPAHRLRCTTAGTTLEIAPRPDGSDDIDTPVELDNLTWIVTDPPMFELGDGLVFAGCEQAHAYFTSVAGPDGLAAVFGLDELLVMRDGKIIGRVPGGSVLAFR